MKYCDKCKTPAYDNQNYCQKCGNDKFVDYVKEFEKKKVIAQNKEQIKQKYEQSKDFVNEKVQQTKTAINENQREKYSNHWKRLK